jgi:adenosylhomocysteine nucleosidase
MRKGVLFLSALPQEGAVLEGLGLLNEKVEANTAHPHELGEFEGQRLVYATTGIGKVNAAITSSHLIAQYRPRLVLFFGLAGALDSNIKNGSLTFADSCWQHDYGAMTKKGLVRWQAGEIPIGPVQPPVPMLVNPMVKSLVSTRVAAPWVNVATGDLFIESAEYHDQLRSLGAQIVDMEGAAVAHAANIYQTPWVIARQISDGADDSAAADFEVHFTEICKEMTPTMLEVLHATAEL